MATSWTNWGVEDPFVEISAGRSLFRVEDLLVLSDAIEAARDERREIGPGDTNDEV